MQKSCESDSVQGEVEMARSCSRREWSVETAELYRCEQWPIASASSDSLVVSRSRHRDMEYQMEKEAGVVQGEWSVEMAEL